MDTRVGQYAFKDMKILMDAKPVTAFREASWKTTKTIEEVFGEGDLAQWLGEGNKSNSGEFEFLQSQYESMVEYAIQQGGDDITDLEVDVIVTLLPKNKKFITKTIVVVLEGVKFPEDNFKLSQGETHAKIRIPFMCLRIKRQA